MRNTTRFTRRSHIERERKPAHIEQPEAGEQHAAGAANAVREVELREHRARDGAGTMRSTPALMSGKVAPRRIDCGRISSAAIVHLKNDHRVRRAGEGGKEMVVRAVRRCHERVVEDEADHADRELDERVRRERVAQPLGHSAYDECAGGHAAEKNGEHDDLRVCAVPDEQSQIPRPDRLVDQSRGAGENEHQREENRHFS